MSKKRYKVWVKDPWRQDFRQCPHLVEGRYDWRGLSTLDKALRLASGPPSHPRKGEWVVECQGCVVARSKPGVDNPPDRVPPS